MKFNDPTEKAIQYTQIHTWKTTTQLNSLNSSSAISKFQWKIICLFIGKKINWIVMKGHAILLSYSAD